MLALGVGRLANSYLLSQALRFGPLKLVGTSVSLCSVSALQTKATPVATLSCRSAVAGTCAPESPHTHAINTGRWAHVGAQLALAPVGSVGVVLTALCFVTHGTHDVVCGARTSGCAGRCTWWPRMFGLVVVARMSRGQVGSAPLLVALGSHGKKVTALGGVSFCKFTQLRASCPTVVRQALGAICVSCVGW